jgi:hypothetical protein
MSADKFEHRGAYLELDAIFADCSMRAPPVGGMETQTASNIDHI